jgi:hypothetical protein
MESKFSSCPTDRSLVSYLTLDLDVNPAFEQPYGGGSRLAPS